MSDGNLIRVLSFKAVIVMTKHDGMDPTLKDVHLALQNTQMSVAMPAELAAPIVISLSDEPPRKDVSHVATPVVVKRATLEFGETPPANDCPF